jgi:hypothetical protein
LNVFRLEGGRVLDPPLQYHYDPLPCSGREPVHHNNYIESDARVDEKTRLIFQTVG